MGEKIGRWILNLNRNLNLVAEKGAGRLVKPQALVGIHAPAATVHSDDPHHATLEKNIKGNSYHD